jgi:hypothetical protein
MQPKGYVYFEKRENCWYARVTLTDEKGKRRNLKKKARDKADAEEKLRVLVRQIEDEGSKVVDYNQMSFNDLAAYYEKHYLKPAVYVSGQKVSGLRDVSRPKELMKHFRAWPLSCASRTLLRFVSSL